ncbi:CHAP domain-containing protein [Pseudomonas sp. CGJS7]|uniref:CHAP domain-containing protein n=1 Tax=Pseudomonas sp. CGJS7 TaxID=3109348 RepID=UPI00300A8DC9
MSLLSSLRSRQNRVGASASSRPRWLRRGLSALTALGALGVLAVVTLAVGTRINPNREHAVGEVIDRLNGVAIHYNGGVNTNVGRRLTDDGYNLGLQYQCVEFVKRYYYQRFGHKMPDSYGHARDFFDADVADGGFSAKRGLLQFHNGGAAAPQPDDLIVFAPSAFNRYGHVAIVASVDPAGVVIAQQNPGPFGASRERLAFDAARPTRVDNARVLGWLRLPPPAPDAAALASVSTQYPPEMGPAVPTSQVTENR